MIKQTGFNLFLIFMCLLWLNDKVSYYKINFDFDCILSENYYFLTYSENTIFFGLEVSTMHFYKNHRRS